MKFCLILAVELLVVVSANRMPANAVNVLPTDPYNTILGSTGWQPAQKIYRLANTSYDWVYWRGSSTSGQVACIPPGGWIAPGGQINVTLCPAAGMATARPGTYSEQVIMNFDPRLVGDVNGDTVVNALDVLLLANAWNAIAENPRYDLRCDFNGDGVIDMVDLLNMLDTFGHTYGSTAI